MRLAFAAAVLLSTGCTSKITTRTFAPSRELVSNPERGFFDAIDLIEDRDYSYVRRRGRTLAYDRVQLDAFRDRPIDQAYLDRLGAGLDSARDHGLKVILRFAYNSGPFPHPEPDAPLPRVLGHIDQLAPLMALHSDVIAVVQAGFVGAWGEWHSSTSGLEAPKARRAILESLLEAVPPDRMLQVRRPIFKQELFGGPLAPAAAFRREPAARIGHHNDCFLAAAGDGGTYGEDVEKWKSFVAEEGRFTPIGGDTCGLHPPRTHCENALAELAHLRFSFLSGVWHPDVLKTWEAQGCLEEIRRRLGYRFELPWASWPRQVRPGETFELFFTVKNTGFATPYNERPVYLVLRGEQERYSARTKLDPRRWEPRKEQTFAAAFAVPQNAAPGRYRLSLWFPDADERLAQKPGYSVRLASEGLWDPATGENVLGVLEVEEPGGK